MTHKERIGKVLELLDDASGSLYQAAELLKEIELSNEGKYRLHQLDVEGINLLKDEVECLE